MRYSSVFLPVLIIAVCSVVRAINFGTTKKLIDTARRKYQAENRMFETRNEKGTDLRVEDFTNIQATIFDETAHRAAEIEKHSRLINWISYQIRKGPLSTNPREVIDYVKLPKSVDTVYCPFEPPSCERSEYRSFDGSCNNLEKPLRGAAFTPFIRDLKAAYETSDNGEDIDDQPRKKGRTSELPSARAVSRTVHQSITLKGAEIDTSFFFTFFGQLVAHDFADRAVSSGFNSSRVDCCSQEDKTPQSECFNIEIPEGDPFRQQGRTCMGVLRSLEATDIDCKIGIREQLNTVTSYLDASVVYGTSKERADFLRLHSGGELIMSAPGQLPFGSHHNPLAEKRGLAFVQTGDHRAPEVAPLTGMHTVWVREHNRLARQLRGINSHWDDEKLFQEARKIVSAMYQHITYDEWLPLLLGSGLMDKYDLRPLTNSFYQGYDKTVDASTTNAVATAALRFGHSLVASTFQLLNKDNSVSSPALNLREIFFKPNLYLMYEQNLMRGLLATPSRPMDPVISDDLTNHLFAFGRPTGLDLAAINIQRGRDHGLPSYNEWRKFLGLSTASSFSSGPGGFVDMSAGTANALSQVYGHPDDVDLWTGGVSEIPLPGAILGPVFANLLGRQFSRYRKGDRFWYETNEQPQAFTLGQLNEIRKVKFARVVCNCYDIDAIQPRAFKLNTVSGNERKSCSEFPQINLQYWKE